MLRTRQTGAVPVVINFLARRVREPQHEIGFRRAGARTAHALLLHGIVGLANAGGVDDRHRIAVEIELHLDDVARGAGMRRYDRDLAPRQLIHQGRLADIRRTGNRNHEAVAQAFTLALCRKDFFDFAQERFDLRQRRRDQFRGHIALVGKIDAGFDQRRRLDDPRAPVARFVAEQALQLAQRLAALPVGVGVNEIVEAFGFGQIELAVLEGAAGEFAGLGGAHIFQRRQRRENRGQHRAPAMDMEFGDVLAGGAGRTRKPEHDRIVQWLTGDVPEQHPGRRPRRRDFAAQRRQRRTGLRARDAHDRDRARRRPDDSAKMV